MRGFILIYFLEQMYQEVKFNPENQLSRQNI